MMIETDKLEQYYAKWYGKDSIKNLTIQQHIKYNKAYIDKLYHIFNNKRSIFKELLYIAKSIVSIKPLIGRLAFYQMSDNEQEAQASERGI